MSGLNEDLMVTVRGRNTSNTVQMPFIRYAVTKGALAKGTRYPRHFLDYTQVLNIGVFTMGIFSRGNQDDSSSNDFLEEVDLPGSGDLNNDFIGSEDAQINISRPASKPPLRETVTRHTGYGIEDAIRLMRSLPRENNEVVVTVVKKTLESTQIQVTDIISDADSKEERIRSKHKTLETEIKELQEQIANRNQQITDLLKDLKETTDVRQRLQLAMDLDQQSNPPPAQAPAAKAQPSQQQPTHSAPEDAVPVATDANTEPNDNADTAAYGGSAAAHRRAANRGTNPHN